MMKPTRTHNSLEELRLHEDNLMRGWWIGDGAWRRPRLIKCLDDLEASKHHLASALPAQDLFFHGCIAVLFGQLRWQYGSEDGDFGALLRQFLGVWSLVAFSSEYASRYNDDDLPHLCYWTGYGMALVGLLLHARGDDEMFAMCFSLGAGLLAVMHLRIAGHLQQCRIFSSFFGFGLVAISGLWALLSRQANADSYPWLPWFAATSYQWLTLLAGAVLPSNAYVPVSAEVHAAKLSGLRTVVFGQMVFCMAVDPTPIPWEDRKEVYAMMLMCVLLLFFMAALVRDTDDVTSATFHALRRCRRTALTWSLVCQPFLLFSMNIVGLGISVLADSLVPRSRGDADVYRFVVLHLQDRAALARGVRLVFRGSAALLLAILLTRGQHATCRAHRTSRVLRCIMFWENRALFGLAVLCLIVPWLFGHLPLVCMMCGIAKVWISLVLVHTYKKQYLWAYAKKMEGPPGTRSIA